MEYIIIGVVILFLLIGLAIANFAGAQFEDTFKKYNGVPAMINMTGGQLALALREVEFDNVNLDVRRTAGELTDAYSTGAKTIILSDSTCDVGSVAALAVVAHEFGHAMQDKDNNKKFVRNRRLAIATKILGRFMFPLAIAGVFMIFAYTQEIMIGLGLLGASVFIFLLALLLKLSTIKVEKDASKRAIQMLKKHEVLDDEEIVMAKAVLKAALLTYVADFLRVILAWTMLTKKTKLIY